MFLEVKSDINTDNSIRFKFNDAEYEVMLIFNE